MKTMYNFYYKNRKFIGILFLIIGIMGSLLFEKYYVGRPFSYDRMLMYSFVIIFIGLHFFLNIKKIWNFIFRKRYLIGLILFGYVVLMGYNGSSIYTYNEVIEPSYTTKEFVPIWGVNRPIRSDEFLVDTPSVLSQYNYNTNFSSINNALMGRETNVLLYPQLPTKSISILTNIRLVGFLFLNIEQAYAFYWFLPYFALFFALFELFRILTKKNNILSFVGTIMLEFSSGLLWWNSTAFLLYGSLATIFFYYLFQSKEKWKKVLFALLLGWAGSSYVMILYPAWMIPYGYLFLVLFICMLHLNKKNIRWQDFLYLIITIIVMCGLLIPIFMNAKDTIQAMLSTEYPGARSSIGGIGWQNLYNYIPSIFYSFSDVGNPCEFSQYMSLYPLPILLAIFYITQDAKKKKYNIALILLTGLAILLSLWNYIPIGIFAKLTFLSISVPERAQMIVGVTCIFILILIMNDYAVKEISKKRKIVMGTISLFTCILGIYIVKNHLGNYMGLYKIIICLTLFTFLFYLFLINKEKSNSIFMGMMIFIGIFEFATIHPINKGLDVLFDKPLAKEIQLLGKTDKNAIWVTIDAPLHLQSYILANGVRVLNSTNYYPNLELWKKFDENGEFNSVYNRYAHLVFNLTKDKTNFQYIQSDLFRVNLNTDDICKLNVQYIATTSSFEQYSLSILEKIYQYNNVIIYKTECS